MAYARNTQMQQTLRCNNIELAKLKAAFAQQMEATHLHRKPLIGQLLTQVDSNGTVQDGVWDLVAESDPILQAMLSGARWRADLPADFEQGLHNIKREITRRVNGNYRYNAKLAAVSTRKTSTTSASGVQKGKQKLRGALGRPYPIRLSPAMNEDGLVDESTSSQYGETEVAGEHEDMQIDPDDRPNASNSRGISESDMDVPDPATKTYPGESSGRRRRASSASHEHMLIERSQSPTSPDAQHFKPINGIFPRPAKYHHPADQHQLQSNPTPLREKLSTRIQLAVDERTVDLKARVATLEDETSRWQETLSQRATELERTMLERMEAMLSKRDVEIQHLKADLEAERSWSAS